MRTITRYRVNAPFCLVVAALLLSGCSSSIPTIGPVQRLPERVLDKSEQKQVIDDLTRARDAQGGSGAKPSPALPSGKPLDA